MCGGGVFMYAECSVFSRIGTYMRAPGTFLALQTIHRNAHLVKFFFILYVTRMLENKTFLVYFPVTTSLLRTPFLGLSACLKRHTHTLLPPRAFKLSNCYFNPIEIAYFKRLFFNVMLKIRLSD